MRHVMAVLALAACGGVGSLETPAGSGVVAPEVKPPPGSLDLFSSALVPGALFTLTTSDAAPGDKIYFLGTAAGFGAGPCPPMLGGICLDVTPPLRLVGTATADPSGEGSLYLPIPATFPLSTLFFQAFVGGPVPSTSKQRPSWLMISSVIAVCAVATDATSDASTASVTRTAPPRPRPRTTVA